jgi:hypothetical protein
MVPDPSCRRVAVAVDSRISAMGQGVGKRRENRDIEKKKRK